ncbi:4-phosphoerythronate dehydrogenase PdxB [Pseudomonas sp. PDM19]|uniref:4-phosphoerythronate dehydrogenase PdxB n=1 Tax=Pseudomonas sp. PDM19 TaxID=2769272 RepID=UPI0017816667|nr:4-phosphoerythronate dehydrogenase PdxB [Pseudomonas sp. PDM19]MBD9628953.1 4-phosphoerythronate dehydrogenase PdxB [Pseudomonas sp. PDM19]
MRILADENIPLVEAFFGAHGDIRRLPGRAIDRAALGDAEVLLVRSVTDVSRELLQGSQVKFVGTCTIGTDHLDLDYFAEAGIAWSSAPGCNARGVVDWVLGSLLALADVHGAKLSERRYGVIGAGQVGGRLVDVLRGLGWDVRVCDPPRAAAEGGDFRSLEEVLRECDVISLHTPLTRDGDNPTRHLIDAQRLKALRPGTWLINASRGGVVDNTALRIHLESGADIDVALDVWEGEPEVNVQLAHHCRIATPHIAGYSLDGKLRGTAQIYEAFCAWQRCEQAVDLDDLLPAQWLAELSLKEECDPDWALAMLCRAVYDPRSDDADFRRSLIGDTQTRRAAFDALRKHYPPRREITGLWVDIQGDSPRLESLLTALGANRVGE